jgi:hypothetical protein
MAKPKYHVYRQFQQDVYNARFRAGQQASETRAVGEYRVKHPVRFYSGVGAAIGTARFVPKASSGDLIEAAAAGATSAAIGAGAGAAYGKLSSSYKFGRVRTARRQRMGDFRVPGAHEKLFALR